eukprot:COSAG02_NODE_5373_length_4390_cov_3.127709_1_plen_82_part_00
MCSRTLTRLPCCLQTGAWSSFSCIISGLLVEQNRRLLPPSYTGSLTAGAASHASHAGRDGEHVWLGQVVVLAGRTAPASSG